MVRPRAIPIFSVEYKIITNDFKTRHSLTFDHTKFNEQRMK